MGQLQIQIGQVSASKTIDNDKMQAITTLIYDNGVVPSWPAETPLPSTAQEKLQAIVDFIALEIRDIARGYRRRVLVQEQAVEMSAATEEIGI